MSPLLFEIGHVPEAALRRERGTARCRGAGTALLGGVEREVQARLVVDVALVLIAMQPELHAIPQSIDE